MRVRWLDLVASYFEEQGFVEQDRDEASGLISLSNGRENVSIRVLGEDASREELLEAVLEAGYKTASGCCFYIAVPRNSLWLIDSSALIMRGVGLLVYDRMGVSEELVPRRCENKGKVTSRPSDGEVRRRLDEVVRRLVELERIKASLYEVEELRGAIARLERLYSQVIHEVAYLKSRLESLDAPRPSKGLDLGHNPEPTYKVREDGLPTFLKANPWVEILASKT